jgi:hypothetical protein
MVNSPSCTEALLQRLWSSMMAGSFKTSSPGIIIVPSLFGFPERNVLEVV